MSTAPVSDLYRVAPLPPIAEGSQPLWNVRPLACYLLILYVCVPHHVLGLLGLGTEIKLFDVAALGILLLLLVSKVRLNKVLVYFAGFCGWYLLRSLFGIPEMGFTALLYGSKFIEYFLLCLVVWTLSERQLTQVAMCMAVSMLALIGIEALGVQITVTSWNGRRSAQFGGPYELGAVGLLMVTLAKQSSLRFAGIAAIVMSGARASVLGVGAFLLSRLHDVRWFLMLGVVGLAAAAFAGERLDELIASLDFLLNSDNWRRAYDAIPSSSSYVDYLESWYGRAEFAAEQPIEASSALRVYSYLLAIKSLGVMDLIYGKGPGFFTSALDASLLRVFVETGAIGLLLMGLFLSNLFKAIGERGFAIAVLTNIMFVDAFFSARFLVVLFILYRLKMLAVPPTGARVG